MYVLEIVGQCESSGHLLPCDPRAEISRARTRLPWDVACVHAYTVRMCAHSEIVGVRVFFGFPFSCYAFLYYAPWCVRNCGYARIVPGIYFGNVSTIIIIIIEIASIYMVHAVKMKRREVYELWVSIKFEGNGNSRSDWSMNKCIWKCLWVFCYYADDTMRDKVWLERRFLLFFDSIRSKSIVTHTNNNSYDWCNIVTPSY